MKRKQFSRVVALFMALLMTFGSVMSMASTGSSANVVDPLALLDMATSSGTTGVPAVTQAGPQVPQAPDVAPGKVSPNIMGKEQGLTIKTFDTPTLNHHLDLRTGQVMGLSEDAYVEAIGQDLVLKRTFIGTDGAFGNGWDFNHHGALRMYAEYGMGELRADGTKRAYTFVQDDPNGNILYYDGDDMVNYELHKGHYEPASGDQLQRVSKTEYVATLETGETITYYGYLAPWRNGQDPREGKPIKKTDRFGNVTTYTYHGTGKLASIT